MEFVYVKFYFLIFLILNIKLEIEEIFEWINNNEFF